MSWRSLFNGASVLASTCSAKVTSASANSLTTVSKISCLFVK